MHTHVCWRPGGPGKAEGRQHEQLQVALGMGMGTVPGGQPEQGRPSRPQQKILGLMLCDFLLNLPLSGPRWLYWFKYRFLGVHIGKGQKGPEPFMLHGWQSLCLL